MGEPDADSVLGREPFRWRPREGCGYDAAQATVAVEERRRIKETSTPSVNGRGAAYGSDLKPGRFAQRASLSLLVATRALKRIVIASHSSNRRLGHLSQPWPPELTRDAPINMA